MKIKMNGFSRTRENSSDSFFSILVSSSQNIFFNIHYYELSFADKVVEGQRRKKEEAN